MDYKSRKINQIKEKWVSSEINLQACIDFWDTFAQTQSNVVIPTIDNNDFLKLIKEENMVNKDGCCLDIGCGTGRYSIALANEFEKLVGIDISNGMLDKAKDLTKENDINNIEFVCSHFDQINLEKMGYKKKFDLVFAHMTPAINSVETFEKIINASKGYCMMSKPTRRHDAILDHIMQELNVTGFNFSAEDDIQNAFDYLWLSGYCPKLHYENKKYRAEKSLDETISMYINRMKQFKNIDTNEEEKIKQIVSSYAVNSMIIEDMSMMISTIYWHV